MSFPCRTSKNQGQHKWGSIKFLTAKRDQFVQSCRYCDCLKTGRFIIKENGAADTVYSVSGLENGSSKDLIPKDVDTETGETK